MKTKIKTWINLLMTTVLGLLGFGTFSCGMYGVPAGDLTFEGQVTNNKKEELKGIQIVRFGGWGDANPEMHWEDYADTLYTNDEGRFYRYYENIFPLEYHRIIATDLSGVYESKDTVVTVRYKHGHGWYRGKATLQMNLELKEKE